MSFQQIIPVFKGRLWLIAAVTLVSVITAAITNHFVEKKYTAAATLVIDFENPSEKDDVLPALLQSNYLNTQVGILESRHVALKVVDALELYNIDEWKQRFNEQTGGGEGIREWIADKVMKNLSVRSRSNNRLVKIEYRSNDPEYASLMANEFANAYEITNLELAVGPAKKSAFWIDEQVAGIREELEVAQSKLAAYKQEKEILATDERLDLETAQLNELTRKLATEKFEAEQAKTQLEQLNDFTEKGVSLASLPSVLSDNNIQGLKSELDNKQVEISNLSATHGKRHPEYQKVLTEIRVLKSNIKSQIDSIVSGLRNQYELTISQAVALEKAHADQKARLLDLRNERSELIPLLREVENAQRNYDEALNRYQQFSMQSSMTHTNVTVLNPAVKPTNPDGVDYFQKLLLAALLGLAVGALLTVLIEIRKKMIRTEEDMSSASGVTVIGVLDKS